MDFIDVERVTYTDLADKYAEFGDLYTRRLWHQLTDKLAEFVAVPEHFRGTNMLDLARKFLSKFENKVDQLRLCVILCAISKQLTPSDPPVEHELERAVEFLTVYLEKKARIGDEGVTVLLTQLSQLRMQQGNQEASKKLLDDAKAKLDSLDGAEAVVYAKYYEAAAEFYKTYGPAKAFYDNSILYLSYTPLEELTAQRRTDLAHDMAVAALVGEGVYNFGEVIEHPIMSALDDTPQAWLRQMLAAFHLGKIDAFNMVVAENRDAWDEIALAYEEKVKEKATLLCLMNLAVELPPAHRTIPFADISARTELDIDQVEFLLMRAMSLGLVKGSIDEVDSTVEITYVQPRVLDKGQIGQLKEKLDAWATKVTETRRFVEEHTAELIA